MSNGLYYKSVGLARAFTIIVPITAIIYGLIFKNIAGVFYGLLAFFGDGVNHFIKKGCKKIYGNRISLPILGKGMRPEGAKYCGTFIHEYDLKGDPKSFGMPSGHSQMATLTATFWIIYLYKKYGFGIYNLFSMGLVLLICLGILYSRWHLKCHTIQQIIFGSISGIIFGIVGFYIYKIYFNI